MRRRTVHNWSSTDLRYPVCQDIHVSELECRCHSLLRESVELLLLARAGTEARCIFTLLNMLRQTQRRPFWEACRHELGWNTQFAELGSFRSQCATALTREIDAETRAHSTMVARATSTSTEQPHHTSVTIYTNLQHSYGPVDVSWPGPADRAAREAAIRRACE
jgi:hypothetical protein